MKVGTEAVIWKKYLAVLVLTTFPFSAAVAQISQEEHLSHHPELAAQATAQAGTGQPLPQQGGQPNIPQSMGMGGMGDMMKSMHGGPPKKEIYPSLMALPTLSVEKEHELRAEAELRIRDGISLLSRGVENFSTAQAIHDYRQMEDAASTIEEGVSRLKSGTSTLRALGEGQSPQAVALSWFKQEMSLSPQEYEDHRYIFGISPFHFVVMVILTLFSVSVIVMYFFKMRRAALLLNRLVAPGEGPGGTSPPPEQGEPPFSPPSSVGGSSVSGSNKVATLPWSGELEVSEIIIETPQIKTFRLKNPAGELLPFSYIPGQYLTIAVNVEGKVIKRSYTIASSPTTVSYCELTIKREKGGKVSPILHDNFRVGDKLKVSGPYGLFTFTGKEANSIVLIGAGVGVTPLMSVIRYLTDTAWRGKISLFFSFRSIDDYLFQKELERLIQSHENFKLICSMTGTPPSGWQGLSGRFTKQMLQERISDFQNSRFHICGPISFMDAIKGALLELGAPKASIKLEAFGPSKEDAQRLIVPKETIVTTSRTVTFSKSGKKGFIPPHLSVLEAAESLGVEIENSCRVGTCGICKVKLLSGQVTMEVEDGLLPEDKAAGYILACQAKSTGDLVIEA